MTSEEKAALAKSFTEAVQEGMVAFVPAFMTALQKRGVVLGQKPVLDPQLGLKLVDPDGKPV